IGYARRPSVAINNSPPQPRAAIRNRDKMTAIRLDIDAREAAECRVVRCQHKAAAKFQIAKARQRRIAIIKRSYRRRIDVDARDPCRVARRIGESESSEDSGKRDERQARHEREKARSTQATRLRTRGLDHSTLPCSSNSSASFSVIAPPSSSASTMVTARR